MLLYAYQLSYADTDFGEFKTKTTLFATKKGAYKALYADVYHIIGEQRRHKSQKENAEKLLQTLNDIKQKWFDYEEINQYAVAFGDEDDFKSIEIWDPESLQEFVLAIVEVQE